MANKNFDTRGALTEREACDYIRQSRVKLWQLRKAGEIPTVRAGRRCLFLREDLDAYLRRNRVVIEPHKAAQAQPIGGLAD